MRTLTSIAAALAVLLAACGPAAAPPQPPAPTSTQPSIAAPTPVDPTAPPAAASVDSRQLVDVFMVSDPETVNLAAGQPQLVEFFAFW